jgi:crossover junction endodeoxyribonuclease RusA
MRLTFEVPGKPVPQGSMRSLGGPGRMVHSNSGELLPYRAHIAAVAMQRKPPDWSRDGAMCVEAVFYLPRPKNHYRTKGGIRPAAPWHPTTKPDGDKLLRALLDALTTAGIWWDDSQVTELHAWKRYDDPPGHLTCTVTNLTEKENE